MTKLKLYCTFVEYQIKKGASLHPLLYNIVYLILFVMANISKTDDKGNIITYWMESQGKDIIVVKNDLGESFKVLREKFENYLEDIYKIGHWYCDHSQDSGVITYEDFCTDDAMEVDGHIDHYMKHNHFPPAPIECIVESQSIKDAEAWDCCPFPEFDQYASNNGHQRPNIKEEKELLNNI